MDKFHRSLGALRGAAHLTMCATDYGSRDSVYAYLMREDLVRIPVAIFFLFFCPLDHLRRGKPNSGVWRRMSTLVPYERRVRPAKYRDVGTRSPRRHEVHAARCCRATGGASTACSGLASRDTRSSPPSNHHNHFVFFVSDAAADPAVPPRRRSCNRPTPLRKHATLTNHNDNICTPVYASNVNTFVINNAHAAASAAATSPLVASRSLGTAAAEPPHPADCIAMAARDICSYGASTACCSCVNLCCSACW